MDDVRAAVRFGPVGIRILFRGRPEETAPERFFKKLISVGIGVTGLVADELHEFAYGTPLYLQDVFAFKASEPFVDQIKGDAYGGDAVGTEPFVGQKTRRAKDKAFLLELCVKPLDKPFNSRTLDRKAKF
jgi:hypothetical protein